MMFRVGTDLAMNPLLHQTHFLAQTIDGRLQPLLKLDSIQRSTAMRAASR